jgi:sugar phosphate isomerase/epimerase
MRLGFFTNAYRYFPFEFAMESLARYGYEGIELWAKGDHITPYDSPVQWQAIKDLIDSYGFEVYAISAHLDFVAPEEETRRLNIDKFLKVLDMAEFFGVERVHTASGGLYEDYSFEKQEEHFMRALEAITDKASKLGLKVGLEAEPEKWLSTPEQLIEIIDNRFSRDVFGVVVDLGHAYGVGFTPEEYLEKLTPYLLQVHFDDVRESDFPHRHLIPGEGDIDFPSVFKKLHEIGYDGWLSMELNRHNDDPDDAAQKADRFMKKHEEYWRNGPRT